MRQLKYSVVCGIITVCRVINAVLECCTLKRKKIIKMILIICLIWIGIFAADWTAVALFAHTPIFCAENSDKSNYTGLGYSYDAYANPISGTYEYCLSVFGFDMISTFTN